MLKLRSKRARRETRLVSGALALLLAAGALLGIAAPAQAAPPEAPSFHITMAASGGDVSPYLDSLSRITDIDVPNDVFSAVVGGRIIYLSTSAAPTFPEYTTSATVEYTVEREGETAVGQISVTFVHRPWVFASGANHAVVAPGETAQLAVEARGAGFQGGVATGHSSYAVQAQPGFGTAEVASDGTVTYTAPADAVPHSIASFKIVATDDYGQRHETYQPFTFTIKGTAEADTFSVDIPAGDGATGTRVAILPDHARGVNPRVQSVLANPNNAAVAYDTESATFTPPLRNWAAHDNGYSFVADYLVIDDNGPASGRIEVRVLRPPVITGPWFTTTVPIGGSATSAVHVLNAAVIPATGGYSIATPPSVGTATVDDHGVVTYTAPADMATGTLDSASVRVTDNVGQSETVEVRFEAYEGAYAPDIEENRPDTAFELALLDGSSGEGKTLTGVTLVSGDAALNPDLAAGTVEVTPTHSWSAGEPTHELELAYTIEDVLGGTDTGAATITVLSKPIFASTAETDLSKTVEFGDSAVYSVQVVAPGNLPQSGAFSVTRQPVALMNVLAMDPVTVNDTGLVTVDTSSLAANGSYEFDVRVEDLVGQSAVQTFRLAVVPGSGDAEGDPQGGSSGDSEGDPQGDTEGGPEGDADADPQGEPDAGPEGDADSGPQGNSDGGPQGGADGDQQGGAEGGADGDLQGGADGGHEGDPQGEPDGDSESDSGSGAQGDSDGSPQGDPDGDPQGGADGGPEGDPQGDSDGGPEGDPQGAPDGDAQGRPEGGAQGDADGGPQSDADGGPQGDPDGGPQGDADGGTEGDPQSEADGGLEGDSQGDPDGGPQGDPDGSPQGDPESAADGAPEGSADAGPNGDTAGGVTGDAQGGAGRDAQGDAAGARASGDDSQGGAGADPSGDPGPGTGSRSSADGSGDPESGGVSQPDVVNSSKLARTGAGDSLGALLSAALLVAAAVSLFARRGAATP